MNVQETPKLLILEEKHGDSYYLINNEEEMARVALGILRKRHEEGYWYPTLEELDADETRALQSLVKRTEEMGLLSDEEMSQLPEALKESAREKVQAYRSRRYSIRRNYAIDRQFATLLGELLDADEEEAVARRVAPRVGNPGARLATRLLEARKDNQYEGFHLERFDNR